VDNSASSGRTSGGVVAEVPSAAMPSAAMVDGGLLAGTSNCTLVNAGVRSMHGSQMRELRAWPGAYRGARLRDVACAAAESPWRFHRFLHPVRACVARTQGHERIDSGFDCGLGFRCRKRPTAGRRRKRIRRRSSLAVDSAPSARDLPSPVASASAGQLLIRHRKGSRSRRVRECRSPPVLCIWS
jgi:hypothetical protein